MVACYQSPMSNVHSWKYAPNQLQHWRQLKGATYLRPTLLSPKPLPRIGTSLLTRCLAVLLAARAPIPTLSCFLPLFGYYWMTAYARIGSLQLHL